MKRVIALVVAGLLTANGTLAQQPVGAANLRNQQVAGWLSTLSQPATVHLKEWHSQLDTQGGQLLQQCRTGTTAACTGMRTGMTRPISVTLSVSNPSTKYSATSIEQQLSACKLVNDPTAPPQVLSAGKCRSTPLQILGSATSTTTSSTGLPLCTALPHSGCQLTKIKNSCVRRVGSTCSQWLHKYQCMGAGQKVSCAKPVNYCPDGGCATVAVTTASTTMATAIAWLEVARQAGTYVTGTGTNKKDLRIFSGTRNECRDKIAWGLGDCCRGGKPDNSTHNRATLINLGISKAIRGVNAIGSRHVRDILFVSTDLQRSLKGLGQGLTGMSTFGVPLSFYGVQVSLTQGALSFGFSPAGFALAVALAVISNLLECSNEEKLLGLQVGNQLCTQVARWCSKRRLFLCKERREAYCCYNSRLAKSIATVAKQQLNQGSGHCSGFTVAELEKVDFSKVDLAPLVADIKKQSMDKQRLINRYHDETKSRQLTMRVLYKKKAAL